MIQKHTSDTTLWTNKLLQQKLDDLISVSEILVSVDSA